MGRQAPDNEIQAQQTGSDNSGSELPRSLAPSLQGITELRNQPTNRAEGLIPHATADDSGVTFKAAADAGSESVPPIKNELKEPQAETEFKKLRDVPSKPGEAKDITLSRTEHLLAGGITRAIQKSDSEGLKSFVALLGENPESVQATLKAVRQQLSETNPSIQVRWETGTDEKGAAFARLKLDHTSSKSGPFTHLQIGNDGTVSATYTPLMRFTQPGIPVTPQQALQVMNGDAEFGNSVRKFDRAKDSPAVPLSPRILLDKR